MGSRCGSVVRRGRIAPFRRVSVDPGPGRLAGRGAAQMLQILHRVPQVGGWDRRNSWATHGRRSVTRERGISDPFGTNVVARPRPLDTTRGEVSRAGPGCSRYPANTPRLPHPWATGPSSHLEDLWSKRGGRGMLPFVALHRRRRPRAIEFVERTLCFEAGRRSGLPALSLNARQSETRGRSTSDPSGGQSTPRLRFFCHKSTENTPFSRLGMI